MFTLYADWHRDDREAETEAMLAAHRAYDTYLRENRRSFPDAAYSYATAEWRNDFSDHRTPHDSWVADVRFRDYSLPAPGSDRRTDLEIMLLGAYRDGHLHLRYRSVRSCSVAIVNGADGPIEVYRDEVRLSERGKVVHEIEFLASDNWMIECSDLEWQWIPL